MKSTRHLHTFLLTLFAFLLFLSCGSDSNGNGPLTGESDNCALHSVFEAAPFFDEGDYSFSCMDNDGPNTIKFPHAVNNHLIKPSNEEAVEYIISVIHKETKDLAVGSFLFAKAYADSISDTKEDVNNLGAEAHFYIVLEDTTTTHYLVFRDCNFMGSISGEYKTGDALPCNLGKSLLVEYATEILNNL